MNVQTNCSHLKCGQQKDAQDVMYRKKNKQKNCSSIEFSRIAASKVNSNVCIYPTSEMRWHSAKNNLFHYFTILHYYKWHIFSTIAKILVINKFAVPTFADVF